MQSIYKLSIIIPVYNRYFELERAIESIVAPILVQLIIVDDGSSFDYTELISKQYENIHLEYTKIVNTGGPAIPRNIGISMAKSEWILFLDSDDLFFSNKLTEIYKVVKNDNFDFVTHCVRYSNSGMVSTVPKGNFRNFLISKGNPIVTSTVCARSTHLKSCGYFDPKLNGVEDYDMWLRLLITGSRHKHLPIVLGKYSESSISYSKQYKMLAVKHLRLSKKYEGILVGREYKLFYVLNRLIAARLLINARKHAYALKLLNSVTIRNNIFCLPKYIYYYVMVLCRL